MDTIFAQATAPGKAGLSVVRISGPLARTAAEQLTGPLPEAGRVLRKVRASDGMVLDEALVLTFASGKSFTGEVVVEMHLHGSVAVVSRVLAELGSIAGLRLAEPGQFTRRAMEAGRLDLAQVEGLADLVEAETEAQRRQAMRVFSGELGDRVAGWRRDMIRAMALVEATIDFADEEVPVDVSPEVSGIIARLKNDLGLELAGFGAAERVRTGFEVAIVGPPNAGKSTLLNRLVGRKAALTSERAGTTRDVIEVRMDIGGLPVTLIDTAGLRDAEDDVERAGIAWGVERAEAADLRVHLILGDGRPEMPVAPDDLVVLAKDDDGSATSLSVSGTTGYGIEPLLGSIQEVISRRASGAGVAVRARHRAALQQGIGFLEDADRELALGSSETELLAESLRLGVRAIDSLVGRVDVEDVLGEIFASFCIGK